jgi:hypothetical protein
MATNGPAVIISKRYSPPVKVAGVLLVNGPGRKKRRVRRGFCHPGTSFIEHYECRGTNCLVSR